MRRKLANPKRGEVWVVDLGMVAKVRPCLVLSVPADDQNDRVLVTLLAHTTSVRNSRFEVEVKASYLKPGAFDAQNLITVPHAKLVRKLGSLTDSQFESVAAVVKQWLGFS